MKNVNLPEFIIITVRELEQAGFESYLVGGAVRDLLLGWDPADIVDWDIATNAKPAEIAEIFPEHSKYEDKFGTVALVEKRLDKTYEVHITPYRKEGRYGDYRHPEKVEWAKSLKEDLKRRDFTINAIAVKLKTNYQLPITNYEVVDPFRGQRDLKDKLIRAVGDPSDRFQEDALRLLRAVRFATLLGFAIEPKTKAALKANVNLIKQISGERIRDEIVKIILSDKARAGLELMDEVGVLEIILPELKATQGVKQSSPHRFDVYEHSLRALDKSVQYNHNLELRLAALFHDIGKAPTQGWDEQKQKYTFYGHAQVGARLAKNILKRLKFPKKVIDKAYHLIYHHMFYYDVGEVTETAVRRLLRRVGGKESFQDLMALRIVDRKATPVPKAKPYKLRHLEFMVDKVSQDPISVGQLAIDGHQLMESLGIGPGPRVGLLLQSLLAEVLDEPQKNKLEALKERAKELNQLTDKDLQSKGERVRQEKDKQVKKLKEKYWVK